ncbi:GIY-YIG nuclease family protein [Rosettibacter firmus]|uniref:GIY-YIG nuclease family protein n=1 Tax=Rosettibacter firmus TaxID=3111522 RepID=UPI00336BEDB4
MFFVYVLRSLKDNKRYIGFTENLSLGIHPFGSRLKEHNNGLVKSTRRRIPLELIYFETFSSKHDALLREKFLKSGQGRTFLNSIIQSKVCNPPSAGESDRL